MKFQIVPKRLLAAAAKLAKREPPDESAADGGEFEVKASPQPKKIVHDKRCVAYYGKTKPRLTQGGALVVF